MVLAVASVLVAANLPTVYPHAGSVPKNVAWVDLRSEKDFDIRFATAAAQGLINRDPKSKEKLYILWSDIDLQWLELLVGKATIQRVDEVDSWQTAVKRANTNKWVLYNQSASHLGDIATTVAGCEGAIPTQSRAMVVQFGGTVTVDLTKDKRTNAEWYQWVIDRYGKQVSNGATSITVPRVTSTHNPAQLRDYLVANKVFTYWLTGDLEKDLPGANRAAEEKVVGTFLRDQIGPNKATLGYPWSGEGYGPGEWGGITFMSQNGQFLVPTDNFTNLSFWTLFPRSTQKPRTAAPGMKFDPTERYAAMVMSDGDNLCTWQNYFPQYFDKPWDGAAPVSWTMGPTLAELAPPIYDHALQMLPKGHSLGSGVSGVGYMAMEEYGKLFGSRQGKIRAEFAKLTSQTCDSIGQEWLWVMRYGGPGSEAAREYAKIPGIRAIMGGYVRATSDLSKANELVGGVPFVHCVHDGGNLAEVAASLEKLFADPNCPQFLHVFLLNWNFNPAETRNMGDFLRRHGVEVVTPETLGSFMRIARAKK